MTGYNLFKNKVFAFRVKILYLVPNMRVAYTGQIVNELTVCLWRQTAVSERPSTALSAHDFISLSEHKNVTRRK